MYYRLYSIAKTSIFLWFVLAQIVIAAPVPQLIKDVNSNPLVYMGPNVRIEVNGDLYYLAYGSEDLVELRRHDPSSFIGSVLIGNIRIDNEYEDYPSHFFEMDGVLYFNAEASTWPYNYVLMKYDPSTSIGLTQVGDVELYINEPMSKIGGVLYFNASGSIDGEPFDELKGRELWKYDPRSSTGPILVADIKVGTGGSDPKDLTEIEGVLYFSADDGIRGREFWKYDLSSSNGPVLVADFYAGGRGSSPQNFIEIEGILYFTAYEPVNGRELWQYDPSTSPIPVFTGNINVGTGDGGIDLRQLTEIEGVLYFTADDGVTGQELWQYDPSSTTGPVLVADLNAGPDKSRPIRLIGIEGVLYFTADDGVTGRELWKYDPSSTTGPVLVADLRAGAFGSFPGVITEAEGVLYFDANDGVTGRERWKYDPRSTTGPVLAGDPYVGPVRISTSGTYSSDISSLVSSNGIAYFAADSAFDGDDGWYVDTTALWQYDPNASSESAFLRIPSGGGVPEPGHLTEVGGVIYFSANGDEEGLPGYGADGMDRELWKYDPSASTRAVLVADINEGGFEDANFLDHSSNPHSLTGIGGSLYFKANDGEGVGHQWWQYNPNASTGPVPLLDLYGGSVSRLGYPVGVGGVLYFSALGKTADGEETGQELWQYDPASSAGPILVGDINIGTGDSAPVSLAEVGGVLYFSAIGKTEDGDEIGRELWQYDPNSSAGPVLVGDINVGIGGSSPKDLTGVRGVLYFSAIGKTAVGVETGRELWQYDPNSSAGPVLVGDINVGIGDSSPKDFTGVRDVLYFSAIGKTAVGVETGRELWQYDPSSSTGPVLVIDIYEGSKSSSPSYLIEMGGNLYFSADDGIRGRELWGIINQSPVAVNDRYYLDVNTTVTVESPGVLSNDFNVEGSEISTVLDTTVSHGTLVFNSNGSFSYTPTIGYTGLDSFSYHLTEGTDTTDSVTVTLTVKNNQAPVANAGTDQLMIEATRISTTVKLDGSGTTDADSGDTIRYLWTWTINSVAYSRSGISPKFSLPVGNHQITLTASDQNGSTSDDTVTVSIVDTTAPTLSTVQDIMLDATSLNGAAVVFTPPDANDVVDPNPTVSCTANSGDIFAIGQTTVTCTATDAKGNSRSTSFEVTITDDLSTSQSLQTTIETGSDDAEEESTGNVSLFSSDLELIRDGSKIQLVGLRFPLQIPAGATITSASIQLTADEISTEPTDLSISAEATADALTFQDLYYDLSNRMLTAANVAWIPAAWTLKGEAGPNQQTPDLSTIVQEIVDQSGWRQGNAIAFIISGTGMREAESYDGTAAPSLKVTYTTEAGVSGAPDAVDDDSPMAVAYTTDVDQQLIVANGADDIVERNDNIGFPAAEVSLYDETSAEGGLVNVNPDGSFSYTPPAGFEGVDSFSYTLENTEGSDSAMVYISVRAVTRLVIPVMIGTDDAEEDESNGQIRLSSSDLELTRDDDIAITQRIGVRFQGLDVPPGATIIEVYIQYTADEKDSEPTNLTVSGEASVSAMTFSTTRFDISERMLTTAQVPWQPEAWNTQEQSSRTRTPDLSTIVQEIVDQDAWSEGNAIAFITKGNGKRVAESFNGTAAPVLHLSYSIEPDTENAYAIGDTGPGGGIVFQTSNGGLNGLEAAPANQGLAMWGCYASKIAGANGTTIESGAQNTANILAACNEAGIAAEIADQYEVNNVTDWYLPATEEALLMHEQRILLGLNANFWTSTENSAYSAFYIRLSQGDARTGNKNVLFDVWPIRAF